MMATSSPEAPPAGRSRLSRRGSRRADDGFRYLTAAAGLLVLAILLELLLANAGRVLTRETLIDRVWGSHYMGDTKTLDVHVKRLRSKIEDDPSAPQRITTIRGLGYKFESKPAPLAAPIATA